jgi:hypothetical protein
VRNAKIFAGVIIFIVGLIYVDLSMRARTAYYEGEKYIEWHKDPSKKKAHFEGLYAKEMSELDRKLADGDLSKAEHSQMAELEKFRRDEAIAESSLKYAYHWYKTAVELFSPPESRWVKFSREKMTQTKELWKQELDSKKIPYEEYMLE